MACSRVLPAALIFCFALGPLLAQRSPQRHQVPYFIHQCHKTDPHVNECLAEATNHLARCYSRGIPELGVTDVEPILIDEISIALGSGPNGYRATFNDIEAFGVSNMTIVGMRTDLNSLQFQVSFYIPKITARAHYKSSGVLIMVQASGGGDYWGEYEGVKAKVYFQAQAQQVKGRNYLQVEDMKMDFSVKDIKMGIENLHNGNTVLQAALNLFINSNAQGLLQEMKPDIKKKMVQKTRNFVNNLFSRIPYDMWMLQ
ncbi:protein takeout isoform X2 [Zootermopsis nevadensis]|uniref:Protein takeout n=1 Tax=Zootermopsis nevadensis TaxID=136037 RepID=A0A067QVA0_ZOONE|nr:protein takeout isoform X1 [Zootermopsis nevadensis]XP_021930055.1 protein takeout isoform X2 [Zootermopsis nevadensis]KDR14113.1 Protein takeout [Zootermopsis nevadensis]